ARHIFRLYGYAEVRTPIFEETELFARSIGADTDIVQKEMYTFADSKGKTFSLRPEGTAPVVRAYIEHGLYHEGGINKLYYMGPMFRHERPQKGRYRQFHQIGVEVLGSDHPAIEAEVIEMLELFFQELGAQGLVLLVNSVGCGNCRPAYIQLLQEELKKHHSQLCPRCQHRSETSPLRVLDCKVASCQPLIEQLPSILDHLCQACRRHFSQFRGYLDGQNIAYQLEPRLVRGLDYYIRTTFEMISDRLGPTQNAVVGGGRYDGLAELLGGPSTKGFGFALGMERLLVLLEESHDDSLLPRPDIFLAYLDEAAFQESLGLASQLRRQGIFAYVDFQERSLKAQMRLANRLGSRFTCIIGEEEMKSGQFPLKRMEDGQQVTLSREDLAHYVRS
ncbi:histidine--tRNA ligase, partial [Acidobacteria bacterium AH-259-D05]|nr:histidine--tRNA ligase [Acidobacteria bacterium AH-259-D05]